MMFRPNIDALVADVAKKINKLNQAAAHFKEEHNDYLEQAAALKAEAGFSLKEAERAAKLARKFEELLNV
jgi:lipase chaperone LimK